MTNKQARARIHQDIIEFIDKSLGDTDYTVPEFIVDAVNHYIADDVLNHIKQYISVEDYLDILKDIESGENL